MNGQRWEATELGMEWESGSYRGFLCPYMLVFKCKEQGYLGIIHHYTMNFFNSTGPSHNCLFLWQFSKWYRLTSKLNSESQDTGCTLGPSAELNESIIQIGPEPAFNVNGNPGSNSQATQSAFNFMLFQHQIRVCFYLCSEVQVGAVFNSSSVF